MKKKTTTHYWKIIGLNLPDKRITLNDVLKQFNSTLLYIDAKNEIAKFQFDGSRSGIKKIKQALVDNGFYVEVIKHKKDRPRWTANLLLCVLNLLFSVLLMNVDKITPALSFYLDKTIVQLFPVALATVSWCVFALWVLSKILKGKLKKPVSSYFLPVIAYTLCLVFGCINQFHWKNLPEAHLFYYQTSLLVSFGFLLELVEKFNIKKATKHLRKLLRIKDEQVSKVIQDQETTVSAIDILEGDLIDIEAGQIIPADGIILKGSGYLDEHLFGTNQSAVLKSVNDSVLAGMKLTKGAIRVKIHHHVKNSLISQIYFDLKNATKIQAPIQVLGNKIAKYLVPFVVVIGFFTLFINYFIIQNSLNESILSVISILIAASPLAILYAAPYTFLTAIIQASKKGIIIKSAKVLEEMAGIKQLIFAKTGILGSPKIDLKAFQTFGMSQPQVESIIAQMESFSVHPVARAITEKFKISEPYKISFQSVNELDGQGMEALDLNGNCFKIIQVNYHSVDYSKRYDILFTVEDIVLAGIVTEEHIHHDAISLIETLKESDIKPVLLSADRKSKCQKIAQQLNIADVYWEKLPEQKIELLEKWRQKYPLAHVNPAYKAIYHPYIPNIAMGDFTAYQQCQADVFIGGDQLQKLNYFIKLVGKLRQTIKLNFILILILNFVSVIFAALGFIPPFIAAIMNLTMLIIVFCTSVQMTLIKAR